MSDHYNKKSELVALFSQFMPPDSIIADPETQKPYECDGLSLYKEMPMLVTLPETVEQARKILKICYQHKIPVVARGAGTGLCAGAMPHKQGVLLSLTKFKNILAIDPLARTATVQPGVRNLAISEAVAEHGLYYGPDPSSQIACSIGGNVAENSGGVHCLKYGLTVHNVLRLEVLTMEGERLIIGSEGLDTPGMDLLALMNGSEGLLGVITEVTVKLLPVPEKAQVLMAAFDSIQKAGDAVAGIIARGIIPAGLEMMDSLAIKAAEDFARAGYPVEAEALLLCELDGTEEEVKEQMALMDTSLKQMGAISTRVSSNEEERATIWKGRKSAFPAVGRMSPDYYCMDGTIPRRHLARVLLEMQQLSHEYGLQVANVFHAGDGNLHPLILFNAGIEGETARAEAFGARILELCVEVGGAITGEHGVGVEKIRQMTTQFNDLELQQFHAIKAAFDSHSLLNPGKGIPLLKHCQEYRALPQKAGQQSEGSEGAVPVLKEKLHA